MTSRKYFALNVFILFLFQFGWINPITIAAAGNSPSIKLIRANVDTDPYSLINAVNTLRASNGLPAYSVNGILMGIAQQHAAYMAANGVNHYGENGSTPWQRALAAGYPLAGELSLGGFFSENITAGSNMSVIQAVAAWQGDAPHLNTMISSSLTEIGAGVVVVGDYVYYVIDCARPTNSGQPQAYTPVPGSTNLIDGTPSSLLVVNTIIPSTPQDDGKIFHVVRTGETLWLIAVSYGVKVVEIRRLNNLADMQNIYPGEKLFIKQGGTSTKELPTITATLPSVFTPTFTQTSRPSSTQTPTLIPVLPVSQDTSTLVLGVIIAAAIFLAAVFVLAGRKK